MKRVGKPWFFIVMLLIFGLAYVTFFGVYGTDADGNDKTYIRGVKDIRWGTDIQGGVSVTFGPASSTDASDNQMEAVRETLDLRLIANNVTDYELYVDKDSDRVMVSFPWKDGQSRNVEETIDELSATAELLFVKGYIDQAYYDYTDPESGTRYVGDSEGNFHEVCVEGKNIKSAQVEYDQNGQAVVAIEFDSVGADLFAKATEEQLNDYIAILMDYSAISIPTVSSVITGGNAQISQNGGFELEAATKLANYINCGALPFKLETKDYSVVDPTLGKDSLKAMMIAGIIAFALVCLFMIFYYRLPGFVACIALLGQAAGSLACVSGLFPIFDSFTLTLPGIAGIILSIGMGVDANIITNERIREEILKGKTIDGAIDSGNENSFSSIFDGNVTVIIVSIILMGIFGPPGTLWSYLVKPFMWMFPTSTTGAIYSFGYTMLIGIIFNFIMGVTASRIMLKSLSRFNVFRKRWLYGGVDE